MIQDPFLCQVKISLLRKMHLRKARLLLPSGFVNFHRAGRDRAGASPAFRGAGIPAGHIPDICHFFYTGSIFKFKILHPELLAEVD